MRKCKQVISMLLVLCMMFAVVSVGIVQGAAADKPQIYQDPPSEPARLGDVDRNGRVDGFDVLALKNSIAHNFAAGYLDYTKMDKNSIDFKVANCNKNDDGTEERIDGFDVFLLQQYIAHVPEARDKGIGEPVYPDPTEPPTQAPTDEETKATVTIYGLNGQSKTREFYIGDTFEVYTSMNVKKNGEDVQIASASGDQTFTDPALSLESEIDSEQLFTDIDTVFPVFGNQAMGRLRGTGWVQYNASTPSMTNAFVFDSDDDLIIVTKYTVMRGGNIEVRNALSYLAAADEDLTQLVTKGAVAPDVELTVNATFEKPDAPKPTEAPTEAPKPTEAPTEAPKPTEAPTEAPKPTEAPTEAPKPTEAPTEAPKPTEAPTEAPKPTEAPTEAPTQPQGKATVIVHGLDGTTETQEFNVGDTFTVYTTLNTSAYNNGRIGSINGRQLYTNAVLKLTDEYTEQDGILDVESMFPVTQYATMASGHHTDLADDDEYHDATRGGIFYNASIASYRGFAFDNNGAILIKSNYEVTAPGNADITNEMVTLAYSDEELTRIIDRGVIVRNDFRLHASFLAPELQPTDAPTEAPKPTEAPTEAPKPTEAPTEAPEPTEAPTEAPVPTEAPTEPAPEDTYIVAGNATNIFGTSWNGNDANNTMTKGDDGIYTRQYTVDAAMKDVQLKAVKNGTTWIGDETGNNVTFNLTGSGTFTVYCDGTKTWVDGDIVSYESGLDVQSVTAVGNGSADGDNWLNNEFWNEKAASNHMTKVSDGIYEAEYTLGEYDTSDPEFKFAVNDAWTHNFGLGDNGVIANGVTTDAIYNGSTNLKITGLTAGTTITMQLDLTGFDYDSKTGAKMTITWTAPAEPTEAPTEAPKPTEAPTEAPKPTEAPTEAPKPTEAPTEAPTQPQGKATVTVHGLDGKTETQEFNVGDTFTVYTTLNTSAYNNGRIGSINGRQLYTNAVLKLTDEYTEQDGILDVESMFPVTQYATMASGHHTDLADDDEYHDATRGGIFYNASIASYRGFAFDNNGAILIKSNYEVTAPGNADITNEMVTLAYSDEDLTRIIDRGVIVRDDFRLHASFLAPELQPTDAPTEAPKPTEAPTEAPKPTEAPTEAPKPTEAPTEAPKPTEAPTEAPKPTEAPTEAPKPTEAPTEAPTQPQGKATVTVHGLDGKTETQEFNVGDTFTVYTTLNTSAYNNGRIGSINGRQLYTNAVLKLTDEYTEQEGILDLESMFPVTQYATMASGHHTDLADDDEYHDATRGGIFYNASIASYRGFAFDNNGAILIKSNYEVTAPGNADITNEMVTLACSDEEVTRIIDRGVIVRNDFRLHASFLAPELQPTDAPVPTEAPKPTEAPTEAPKPTEAPTEAPKPTEAPTEAPKPTEAPTEAPKPTEAPTEAPKPTEAPTEAPKPTEAPTEAPKPTVAPTEAPDVTDRTIIFSNNKGFGTVNIYYWSEEDQPVDWPGVPMTYLDTNEMGEKRYTIELPAGMTNYVINDGGTQQTVDIDFTGATGVYMTDKDSSGNYEVAFYDIGKTDPTPEPTTAPQPTTPTPSVADGYYLVGTMTDWKADAAYKFSENTANPGEYMLSTTLTATDGVKAVKVENGAITTWYPDGMDNEYTVDAAHAGDVTIYFKTTYQSDWSTFGGYLYIDGGSAPTPEPTTAPTEAPDVTDRTIIFSNNKGFGTVNIYYWSEEDQPVDWPGVPMPYLDTNEMGEKRYTIELPAGMTNYVINDGGTQQTVDIDFTGSTGVYMTDKDSSGNYAVAFYDIGKTDPTPEPTTAPQPTTPTPTEAAKNYVYLNAGGSKLWDQANARFKLYVWNDDGEQWLTGTAVNGKYQFEVPAGYTDGIFVRMDPAKTADDWDSVWNQTGDLTLQIGKTYTITSWTGGDNGHSGGSWS